jgi:hypothetical protein
MVAAPDSPVAAGQPGDYALTDTHLYFYMPTLGHWGRTNLETNW